ncbi:MAG: UbiA family prenyltransferase, partial [Pseudomonadota bacterium]
PRDLAQLARFDRPIGWWLLFWPCVWGIWLAGAGWQWALLGWLLLGSIAMRGAGCVYNDIVDRDLDRQVARTRSRPLASGAVSLDEPLVLKTDDYPDLAAAWRPFLSQHPGFEPQGASLALAGPVAGDTPFKLTNNDWAFEPASMPASLGVKHLTLLNDFAAIAHGIAAPGAPLEL